MSKVWMLPVVFLATPAFAEDGDAGWIEQGFIDAFWFIVKKILSVAMDLMDWFTGELKGALPDGLSDALIGALDILGMINIWIPLQFAVTLLLAYVAIWTVATLFKYIIRYIPGIG